MRFAYGAMIGSGGAAGSARQMALAGGAGDRLAGDIPSAAEGAARSARRGWRKWKARLARAAFMAVMAAILVYGYWLSSANKITAAEGWGYWLGVLGGSLMLLLLVYPVRKRFRWTRSLGPIPRWFQLHMMFGILGPVLIIVHMGYSLGSPNSTVAFLSMMTVALSGILGRYFYSRIHLGLYGAKTELRSLLDSAHVTLEEIAQGSSSAGLIRAELERFETEVLPVSRSFGESLKAMLLVHLRSRRVQGRIRSQLTGELEDAARERGWTRREHRQRWRHVEALVAGYFDTIRQVAEFSLFERLFSLWHVLHVPLFILLVLTAIAHVIAVHLY